MERSDAPATQLWLWTPFWVGWARLDVQASTGVINLLKGCRRVSKRGSRYFWQLVRTRVPVEGGSLTHW